MATSKLHCSYVVSFGMKGPKNDGKKAHRLVRSWMKMPEGLKSTNYIENWR